MSQSPEPTERQDNRQLANYRAGWRALNELLSRGGSLSGRERNGILLNCGNDPMTSPLAFAEISALTRADFKDDTRGIALTDWDEDGDLDFWTMNRTAPRLRLLLNQTPQEKLSLTIKLEGDGQQTNRDAIGARVELHFNSGPPLLRSLYAGHGYLSQSSKTLHFGLGSKAGLQQVTVHWPAGKSEMFSGVQPNKTHILKQHTGRATSQDRSPRANLATRALPVKTDTLSAQVLLPRRLPLPELTYTPSEKRVSERIQTGSKPLLLLLYASWCPNCAEEIKELTAHRQALEAAGLDVLLLSVDHLQESSQTDKSADWDLLQRLGVSFNSGRATAGLMNRLAHLENALFELQPNFVVPYSFLLDAKREVAAIYRGRVPLDTLLYDAKLAQEPEAQMRDAAIPFAGRWYTSHPERLALLELLADHFRGPFPEESLRYLEQALPFATEPAAADQVRGRVAGLHYKLGTKDLREQRYESAASHFKATLIHRPNYAAAHHDLGAAFFSQGKLKEAEACFLRTLELSPGNAKAQHNLDIVHQALIRKR